MFFAMFKAKFHFKKNKIKNKNVVSRLTSLKVQLWASPLWCTSAGLSDTILFYLPFFPQESSDQSHDALGKRPFPGPGDSQYQTAAPLFIIIL